MTLLLTLITTLHQHLLIETNDDKPAHNSTFAIGGVSCPSESELVAETFVLFPFLIKIKNCFIYYSTIIKLIKLEFYFCNK